MSVLLGSALRVGVNLSLVYIRSSWVPGLSLVALASVLTFVDPPLATLVAESSPEKSRGAVLGFYQSVRSIGGEFLGPLIAGVLYEWDRAAPFQTAAFLVTL